MLPKAKHLARYAHGAILTSGVAHAAVRLLDIQPSAYPDLSSTCISVLNQGVACEATLGAISGGDRRTGVHRVLEESDLESLCTDGCAAGLDAWAKRVSQACAGVRVTAGTLFVTPDAWAQQYLEAFNSVCLVDETTASADGTPGPTPTCDGTTYEISSGQTCQDICSAARISTTRLIHANDLGMHYCYKTLKPGTLCIPDDATCTPYAVERGDTCASIARSRGVTYLDIVSWNPELGKFCRGIKRHIGYSICVSSPGGKRVKPRPIHKPRPTSRKKIWDLHGMTPVGQVPLATRIPGEKFTVIDEAPDTRQDCLAYHIGGAPLGRSSDPTSPACGDVAARFRITLEELLNWNPSLPEGSECTLRDDAQYCVRMVEDIDEEGMTEACVETASATWRDDCRNFRLRYGLAEQEFTAWNPVVGGDCSAFLPGMTYCIRAEHFRHPGMVSTCNKFVTPEETRWRMNPCKIMEEEYSVSHERFVAWNPDVGNACTAVFPGYDYCVSTPNYKPTSSASATASETPQETPTYEL